MATLRSHPKVQFLSILDKYFKSYGNVNAIRPLFNMDSYQIWPCHVTQAENLSFPYLKSYFPLNCRKSHQISCFCCIPNGSYKEDNLKEGRICPPPPPSGIGLTVRVCTTKKFFSQHVFIKISNCVFKIMILKMKKKPSFLTFMA